MTRNGSISELLIAKLSGVIERLQVPNPLPQLECGPPGGGRDQGLLRPCARVSHPGNGSFKHRALYCGKKRLGDVKRQRCVAATYVQAVLNTTHQYLNLLSAIGDCLLACIRAGKEKIFVEMRRRKHYPHS